MIKLRHLPEHVRQILPTPLRQVCCWYLICDHLTCRRNTPRPATVFTKQQRIAELARNGPEMAFTTLAHHIDINWMHMAYAQTRKDGAVGVDGQIAADTRPT